MCPATCDRCTAFANWAATSSVAYEQARNELRTSYLTALGHGLSVADLARASGRDEEFINRLIKEGSL
jgi:hypothetical protein